MLLLTKGVKGIDDTVSYDDGTAIPLSDLMAVEPELIFPENVVRVEYIPGKRLSFFTEDGQFGREAFEPENPFEGTWDLGEKLIGQKQQYLDAIDAAKPKPEPIPDPLPVPDTNADLKAALDTYLAGDDADTKSLKAVLIEWRKTLAALLLVLLMAAPSWALEHYSNVAQDQNGRAIVGATVTVYRAGTTALAVIYSDDGVTQKANPFTTALDGIYDFYAANGRYDITITKTGYTSIYWDPNKLKNLALFDPTHFIIPFGDTFPTTPTPTIGDWFVLTNDGGTCAELSGSNATPCRWNGTTWVAMGGGGGTTAQGLGPNFALSGGNIITGSSETKKWTLLGTGGQANNGGVKYQHSNGTWVENCIFGGVEGDCDKYVQLNANKKWGVKNSGGTVIHEVDAATNKLSVGTIDCSLANVSCTLSDERHFAVATVQAGVASSTFDMPSSNAPAAVADVGSNTLNATLDFNATTDSGFQDRWILPTGFVSVNVHFRWKAAATSGNVVWCARLVRISDGATSDPAFPAQAAGNCVQDAAKGTTLQENTATITGVTCTSCVAGDRVAVLIERDANDTAGTDNMTGDAKLIMYGRTFVVTQ